MSEDCYAVIQFWDALLSIGHACSFPQTIAWSYGRNKTPPSPEVTTVPTVCRYASWHIEFHAEDDSKDRVGTVGHPIH
jgi:hypothetical protein